MNYYNEHDPKAAQWIKNLIDAGELPAGDVDTRDIETISPHELTGYTQQHFFAGIGGWSYALKLAGWPANKPVRTGSCPCQPFSQTGLGLGETDERHLWPVFRDLIVFGEPTITFGEQVASKAGRVWLSRVRADLEGMGYGVGAADLCSAGVGSPNIRQRIYWMAYADGGNACTQRKQRGGQHGQFTQDGAARGLGDTNQPGPQGRHERGNSGREQSPWSSSVVLPCTDGKARRIEPGSFPLAHGISGRVGLLRGYGNAINPFLAAEFIQASLEALNLHGH